jgi:hypothetical protein
MRRPFACKPRTAGPPSRFIEERDKPRRTWAAPRRKYQISRARLKKVAKELADTSIIHGGLPAFEAALRAFCAEIDGWRSEWACHPMSCAMRVLTDPAPNDAFA